ncbi:protein kinase domain-containing protein [Lusitaniella coriacea]|uniref:serine/threonine protein kinase n=1 Tax=Lusitaniella coriacea TaxID=1983105 RepID=UPI003CF3923F
MLNAKVNTSLIGQLLHQRYQILRVLGCGAFGQVYIAQDTLDPDQSKCVIKHYQIHPDYPHLVKANKRIFLTEAETLSRFGIHPQIPKFLGCFENRTGFYLVQEWVVGQTLNDYLFFLKTLDRVEREMEVVSLFRDVLAILDFIHRQGLLHCDLKPNNLIRRAQDGKWVVIDFGNAQPVRRKPEEGIPVLPSKTPIAVSPSGYLAAELTIGKPYPNSDLYALGMMGIEVLTGQDPAKLQLDLEKGAIHWSYTDGDNLDLIGCGEALEAILRKMVRYNPQERYSSARDVLQVLEPLSDDSPASLNFAEAGTDILPQLPDEEEEIESALAEDVAEILDRATAEAEVLPEGFVCDTTGGIHGTEKLVRSFKSPLLGLLVSVGVVFAVANAIAITFGLQTLGDTNAADPGVQTLSEAAQAYQKGNLEDAIALAKTVPSDSFAYQESQSTIQQWKTDWERAEEKAAQIEQAFEQGEWNLVLSEAQTLPDIDFWQEKLSSAIARSQQEADTEAQRLLDKAFAQARNREFTRAIANLQQISPHTALGEKIQPKLTEYRHKQQVRAKALLQQAYNLAAQRDFLGAIYFLEQISPDTSVGAIARAKLEEYGQKQRIKEKVETAIILQSQASPTNPGELLQELPPPVLN